MSPVRETEVLAARAEYSKTFTMPDGRIRTLSRLRPIHWLQAGAWTDVDATPQTIDGGITWRPTAVPYTAEFRPGSWVLRFQSPRGGDVTLRLTGLDGLPPGLPGLVTLRGTTLRVPVALDLELEIRFRARGVEIVKWLRGALAPRRLTWGIVAGDTTGLYLPLMNTIGRDNVEAGAVSRQIDLLNRRRMIELLHTRTPDDLLRNPGKVTYAVTEEVTGRTYYVDPVTRERSLVDELQWPVEIDVTVTESIVADGDDGRSGTGSAYWRINYIKCDSATVAAFRFQTVNVPQGQVLDSATFTMNVTSRSGAGNATFAGEDVDDAAAWADTSANSPETMTKTTATAVFATPATTGIKTLPVTSVVQEIIDRVGWAANNDLRLGVTDVSGMGASYWFAEDYNAAGTAEAELEIIYTVAGAALVPRPTVITQALARAASW